MSKPENRVLSDITHLVTSNLFKHVLSLVTAFIRPKWLSPEHFGIWSLLNTMIGYMAYFDLGLRSAMRYEIPKNRDDSKKLAIIQGTSFWAMLILVLVLSLLTIVYVFVADIDETMRNCVLIVVAIVILSVYFEQRFNEMRGYQEFQLISKMVYLRFSVNSILTLVLIYFWDIYGAFIAVAMSILMSNIFLRLYGTQIRYIHFDWGQCKHLIRLGFPIMIMAITEVVLRMTDKWVVVVYLGTRELGYYGIAAMILGPLLSIPGVSRDVTESLLMKEFSHNNADSRARIVERYLATPLLQTCCLTMPILIGIAFFAVPAFIHLFLPQYVAGIQSTQILLIGSFFMAVTFPIRGIVIANGWQKQVAFLTLLPIVFSLLMNIYLVKLGFGIDGVALGSSLSFVFLAILLNAFVLFHLRTDLKYSIKKLMVSSIAFPLMCGLIFIIEYRLPIDQYTHWFIQGIDYDIDLLVDQMIKCSLFLLAYGFLPLLLWKMGAFSIKSETINV